MAINAGFRMAYGVGGPLSPAAMARLRMAPDTPERPEARKRGRLEVDLAGGMGFSAAGVLTAGAADLARRG
jgi:hypothetical protein